MPLLDVQDCGIDFGGLHALLGLKFSLEAGELLGIIGPNGAGKTTFFNLLTGVYTPTRGSLHFEKTLINPLRPHQISRLGLARTFQNIRLFEKLSVLDNVRIAFNHLIRYSSLDVVLSQKCYHDEEKTILDESLRLLEEFSLKHLQSEIASNLSYGDQRRLEMVRALATKPRLLLLDEPAAGMNHAEKMNLVALIKKIHQELGLSIILIEHDMSVVMNLCPRIIVLDYGIAIAEGPPEQIKKDPKVIEAYLGERVGPDA